MNRNHFKVSNQLEEYFSEMSFSMIYPLVAKNQNVFSKVEKSVMVDLKWLYDHDDFVVKFTTDENGNNYLYEEESRIPERLKKYLNHADRFSGFSIELRNIGRFMLYVLGEEGVELNEFEKKITILMEKQDLENGVSKNKIKVL